MYTAYLLYIHLYTQYCHSIDILKYTATHTAVIVHILLESVAILMWLEECHIEFKDTYYIPADPNVFNGAYRPLYGRKNKCSVTPTGNQSRVHFTTLESTQLETFLL